MKSKYLFFLIFIVTLTGCGFKLSNLENNYKIVQINTLGDKQINFKLKNKLLISAKNNSENLIEMDLKTTVDKTIKEKNISNQINKYEISIIVFVKYNSLNNKIYKSFSISKSGDFNVSSKYSETLSREKQLINSLINDISDEIAENLALNLNDL